MKGGSKGSGGNMGTSINPIVNSNAAIKAQNYLYGELREQTNAFEEKEYELLLKWDYIILHRYCLYYGFYVSQNYWVEELNIPIEDNEIVKAIKDSYSQLENEWEIRNEKVKDLLPLDPLDESSIALLVQDLKHTLSLIPTV